jgi:uncharacterized protein Usg
VKKKRGPRGASGALTVMRSFQQGACNGENVSALVISMGWLAVLLIIGLLLALLSWFSNHKRVALVSIYFASFFLAVGSFEGYLVYEQAKGDGTRIEGSITDEFNKPDDLLGYAPRENTRVTARKFYGTSLIYDVVYTIGSNGLRITPLAKGANRGCVVFFGDSVTFGEGVNDEESFPFRVGLKTAGEYAARNFAFSGYGPHQMLANLQAHREGTLLDCTPTHFIYLCIPAHVERVAGLAFWDRHGPRFRLKSENDVVRDGNFDDPNELFARWPILQRIEGAFDSFLTWQKLFGRLREAGPADLALLIAIIREAAQTAHVRYRGSHFDVILWDGSETERVRSIESSLQAGGIPVHRITKAIPDFRANWRQYVLSEYDLHPNPHQLDLLADYVTHTILDARVEPHE